MAQWGAMTSDFKKLQYIDKTFTFAYELQLTKHLRICDFHTHGGPGK